MYNPKYIANQEKIKTRAIYRMFQRHLESFASLLEKESKSVADTVVSDFMDENGDELPEYISDQIPNLANRGMNDTKKDHKSKLGTGYSLHFDVETSPASQFVRAKEALNLSQKDGSISKTTEDELRKIIADGIDEGLSYGQIGKQIRETEPFVFSRSRAELIAIQEVGQAYGFGNFQPYIDMQSDGYEFEKKWLTSHDPKVRETHRHNEEEGWVDLDYEYEETGGDIYAPSKEFRCRCYMTQRIKAVK